MSTDTEYLPLQKAIDVTGVSEPTLARFADAGYLKTKKDASGQLEFNKDELFSLFKIRGASSSNSSQDAPITPVQYEDESTQEVTVSSTDAQTPSTLIDQIEVEQTEPTAAVIAANNQELQNLKDEINKLKALSELHEKYIDFKESEIKSLTEERNWLRARLEKLEEKTERDQIILVSITETHRKLVHQMDKPKSGFISALQRIGLLPQPAESSSKDGGPTQPGLRHDD